MSRDTRLGSAVRYGYSGGLYCGSGVVGARLSVELMSEPRPLPVGEGAARGSYIAISGNTGAGKSTLIRALVQHAAERGHNAVGVQERALHHSCLPQMF